MKNKSSNSNSLSEFISILRHLRRICWDLHNALMEHPQNDPAKNILLSYLTKISHTLEAVILLYNHSLYHEAQSLIRIAFELYVTFLSFLQILHRSPIEACTRVWDSVMLEKVKQQKASGFKGLDLMGALPVC